MMTSSSATPNLDALLGSRLSQRLLKAVGGSGLASLSRLSEGAIAHVGAHLLSPMVARSSAHLHAGVILEAEVLSECFPSLLEVLQHEEVASVASQANAAALSELGGVPTMQSSTSDSASATAFLADAKAIGKSVRALASKVLLMARVDLAKGSPSGESGRETRDKLLAQLQQFALQGKGTSDADKAIAVPTAFVRLGEGERLTRRGGHRERERRARQMGGSMAGAEHQAMLNVVQFGVSEEQQQEEYFARRDVQAREAAEAQKRALKRQREDVSATGEYDDLLSIRL